MNVNPPWPPERDGEADVFYARLTAKYPSGIDALGILRWCSEWRMHVANGLTPDAAWQVINIAIDVIRAGGQPAGTAPGPYDVPWPPDLDHDAEPFVDALSALWHDEHPEAAARKAVGAKPLEVDGRGWVRWSSDYRIHRANGASHEAALRTVQTEVRRIWGVSIVVVPAPTTGRRPAGRARLDGRTLVDDAGPFLGGFVSYFHGPRTFAQNRGRFDEDLGTLQTMQADAVRIISDLGWPLINGVNKEWDGPAHIEVLIATIDAFFEAGLRTQLTLLGSLFGARIVAGQWEKTFPYRLDNQPARLRYAEAVCRAVQGREDKLALVEVCNEPENGGVGPLSRDDQVEIQRLLKSRLPRTIVCLGAPGGHLGVTSWDGADYAWYGDHGDLVLPHLDRDRRDIADGHAYGHIHQGIHSAQDRYAWGNNEPIGPRSSGTEESDPTRLRMAATATWMCRGAFYTYHAFSGIGLDGASDYPLAHEPGVAHVFDARAVLPADLPQFTFHNWHWASNPFETLDGCLTDVPGRRRGTIRTLAMTSGPRRVFQIIKVGSDGAAIRPRERMRLTRWEHDGTCYTAREERDYPSGQAFELAPAEDVLFTGTTN
jgi:hypothetical protein